jgi:aminoglycoside phosphotransferase (APT) family kinase protein
VRDGHARIDAPVAVREGEELDVAQLQSYLDGSRQALGRITAVSQFPGGFSNLTYLIEAEHGEAVLRRPPAGTRHGTAHDMGREFRILVALAEAGIAAPRPLVHCDDPEVLGAPFYLMERVRGVILRGRPPDPPPPATMRELSSRLIDTLAGIHAIGAATLPEIGHGDGYVERQVKGWASRYERARTDDVPEMDNLARWLDENRPAESDATLVHNDYKYDNVVLDPADLTRILAILDWELATVGDPLLDLGTTLGYWAERDDPPFLRALGASPSVLPGNLSRAELAERYLERRGLGKVPLSFYHAFGLFKIAVIAQQIYARYKAGYSRDSRFARLDDAVRALAVKGGEVAAS